MSLLLVNTAFAVSNGEGDTTRDDSIATSVELSASLNAEGKVDLSWTEYDGTSFKYYKVVHSTINVDLAYPEDSYFDFTESLTDTTAVHDAVVTGTNYYRVCVVTTDNVVGCSNVVTIEAQEDSSGTNDYTEDDSIAVTLEGSLNAEDKAELSWNRYEGEDFRYYKVMHSQTDADVRYPDESAVKVSEDQDYLSVTYAAKPGTNYYRVCVVTTEDVAGCSNTVTLDKEGNGVFLDIETHWSKDHVFNLKAKGVVDAETNYNPEDTINRAAAMKMIVLSAGLSAGLDAETCNADLFSDLNEDDWFCVYATSANEAGIVTGEGDTGNLNASGELTRAAVVKMVLEAKGLEVASEVSESGFADVSVEAWYAPYVAKAKAEAIVSGKTETEFAPGDDVTRAELAKIVDLTFYGKKENGETEYTEDDSIAVTLEGSLTAENEAELSWNQYEGDDFRYYKVMHSTTDMDVRYPGKSAVEVGEEQETTTSTRAAEAGTNYYRVCVVTTDNVVGCSNTVTLEVASE